MNKTKLRLGPLPKAEVVKLTISVSAELKTTLDRYAELHSREYEQAVDAVALIPHMLHAFMARDREFKRVVAKASSDVRSKAGGPLSPSRAAHES
ncbi:DUF2274 domain-containing protein [Variovorax boronicumulans]|uniref:DUF2274 domain-containing protein n=1 Tax=Variovorax boronicumulans TaxID=436515 RepID=UPI0012E6DD09|nr:DUF2274 domain-containing protein [Variovorax boronicumulans]GER09540.1 hypothetical protein VHAB30_06920 [Variovorax boronicumulans]